MMQEKSVISYLSDKELEELREISLGECVQYLCEKMNEVFDGEYSRKDVIKRIKKNGVSVTQMALYQLESGRIERPNSFFLMGLAQELGVTMEFLLQGPPKEDDQREFAENIRYGLKALQELDEQDRQTIMKIIKKFAISKDFEKTISSLSERHKQ